MSDRDAVSTVYRDLLAACDVCLYTGSIVALDVRTGKLAWFYQAVPHDVRDYDLTHVGPVFATTVDGRQLTVIALTGKDGLMRVLDRDTRNVLYSVPFTTRENTTGPIGTSFTHVCPGVLGGHEWNGAAYSPRLSALFVPATDWCNQIRSAAQPPDPQAEKKRGQFFGGEFQLDRWSKVEGWLRPRKNCRNKSLTLRRILVQINPIGGRRCSSA